MEVRDSWIAIYGVLLHINFLPFLLLFDTLQYVLYLTVDLLYSLSTTIIFLSDVLLCFGSFLPLSCLLRRDVIQRQVLVV